MKRLCADRKTAAFSVLKPLGTQLGLLIFLFSSIIACTKQRGASSTPVPVSADSLTYSSDNTGYSTPLKYQGYRLVWHDEFEASEIDTTSWVFENGNGPGGWGNNELEYYTDSRTNAFTDNGTLVLEARKEEKNGFQYTSARMITKGKRAFTYGRVDIRAKLPSGKGLWPALWMLGQNVDTVGWPVCGEIDIMELLGNQPNKVYGTLHWGAHWTKHQSMGRSYSFFESFSDQF